MFKKIEIKKEMHWVYYCTIKRGGFTLRFDNGINTDA